MIATVNYFGPARERLGIEQETVEFGDNITVAELWDVLLKRHPELQTLRSHTRLAVDMKYVTDSDVIDRASEIAVIPPVAGG